MKKVFLILLILVIVLSITFPTFAHSGRTDSQGGHHDRNLPVTCRKKVVVSKIETTTVYYVLPVLPAERTA